VIEGGRSTTNVGCVLIADIRNNVAIGYSFRTNRLVVDGSSGLFLESISQNERYRVQAPEGSTICIEDFPEAGVLFLLSSLILAQVLGRIDSSLQVLDCLSAPHTTTRTNSSPFPTTGRNPAHYPVKRLKFEPVSAAILV
jgi:hypothetical protein